MTSFSTAFSASSFWGFAYDPVTHTYYSHEGYGGYGTNYPLNSYATSAAFAANAPSSSITLTSAASGCAFSTPCNPIEGTYFTEAGGSVYARGTDNTAELARWNANTGAVQQTAAYAAFGGTNGTDTFNWAGFSGMNIFQDSTGTYLLAKKADNTTWEISSLGSNLAVSNTFDTGLGTLGFGFLIDGKLFLGTSFSSNLVSYEVDVQTGQVTPVSFTLSLPDTNQYYFSDTLYDPNLDRLYVWNMNNDRMYSVDNAFADFVAPEPALFLPTGAALLGAIFWARRRRAATR